MSWGPSPALASGRRSIHDFRVVAADLDHPECVNLGPDGKLYAGSEDGRMFRIDPASGTAAVAGTVTGGIGGLCLDAGGAIYECNYGRPAVNRIAADGAATVHSLGPKDAPAILPNYPCFDERGNLWFSDSGSFYKPNGRLMVVRPDGRTEIAAGDQLQFPNGLALDESGRWLYVVLSNAASIARFPVDGDRLGDPEIWVTLPGAVPDGLAFAASGNLYVACYVPDAILVIDPARRVQVLAHDACADVLNRPTNCCFGRDTTLYVSNLGGFTVMGVDVGEKGLPLRYPRLPT
ncbi:MAG TPA: SMP-30/gluconolactonase/LRE family protein [Gammaproteobacteria bacterium]|nr:SMP-30/gluconolactonase/LRE family protein [Gammaproteobacteria bacterium]